MHNQGGFTFNYQNNNNGQQHFGLQQHIVHQPEDLQRNQQGQNGQQQVYWQQPVHNQEYKGQQHIQGHFNHISQPQSENDQSWQGKLKRNVEKVFRHYDYDHLGQLEGDFIFKGYKSLTILMRVHYLQAQKFWNAVGAYNVNEESKVNKIQMQDIFSKLHKETDCHNVVVMAPQNCPGW